MDDKNWMVVKLTPTWDASNSRPGIYLHVYVTRKTTDRGVISASEPQRREDAGQSGISTSQRSSFMNGATLGPEWAFVSLGSAAKRARTYEWTLPWGPGARGYAMETRTRGWGMSLRAADGLGRGPPPHTFPRAGTVEKRQAQRLEKGLLSLAVPTSPTEAFTGRTFTNHSVTELP